jgi:penicillin-binding protein 1A
MLKRLLIALIVLILLGAAGGAALVVIISGDLPKLITVKDYEPRLVSEVYARGGEKIGEFYREKRTLVAYEKIPKHLIQAFLAAEDDQFFQHGGINYLAIFRATLANLKAGHTVQGGSTITQQVAKTLLLTNERTMGRKVKEALLALRMEQNLKKEDILYLYLNQIYFGQGAYGIASAAEVYFQKTVDQLTLPEMAILGGLPKAPSDYSPVKNPKAAKDRQRHVLHRMEEVGFITHQEADKAVNEPVVVNVKRNYGETAPFYVETLRQILSQRLGESAVLDKGIKVYTGLDYKKQLAAQEAVKNGLRELDKRQGFRGANKNLQKVDEIADFLLKSRNQMMDDLNATRVIRPDGTVPERGPLNLTHGKDARGRVTPNIPAYLKKDQIVDGVVTKVDDTLGLVTVRFAETQGLIDLDQMRWAHKVIVPNQPTPADITKPSQALKVGDVIEAKILGEKFKSVRLAKLQQDQRKKSKSKEPAPALNNLPHFDEYAELALEQEPAVEGALISIDQDTQEVIALVGGYDFARNQFNRALQAARQTGSSFKVFVYASALDKGFTASTPIIDAPVVFEEHQEEKEGQYDADTIKKWKPGNDSKRFGGDVLFRNALIRSLNVPTVKIIQDVGVEWAAEYARRLGIFSPLNMDFTLGLGSSSVTLYEMTKAFSEIGRMGKRTHPLLIHKVVGHGGENLLENLTLDERFQKELAPLEQSYEEKRQAYLQKQTTPDATADASKKKTPDLYFTDPEQLLKPTTAYIITDILQGVINEPGGTGGAARALGRPAAGKTGTTSDYVDAWFIGFTPQIATGVWVGFDEERTLGHGEVGARAALPAWLEYMKSAHEGLPELSFQAPAGIVFANIDRETGRLASASSKSVVRQAFAEGTEPSSNSDAPNSKQNDTDFLKEDMSN